MSNFKITISEEIIVSLLACFIKLPIMAILHGITFKTIWNWHLVSLGVSQISIGTSIAILLLVDLVTFSAYKMQKMLEDDYKIDFKWLFNTTMYDLCECVFILLMGYFALFFF